MVLWQGSKAELFTAVAAALVIPFYLGFIHLPVAQLLIYNGAAGAAIAAGEYVERPEVRRGGLGLFLMDASAWICVIALLGGLAYFIALLF